MMNASDLRIRKVASLLSHAVAALGIGACFYKPEIPKGVWVIGVACSVIPDLDVIGFRFGIRYGDFWGHRGFTHSLVFAALLATAGMFIGFRRVLPSLGRMPVDLFLLGDCKSRIPGRHDERRSGSRVLCAI